PSGTAMSANHAMHAPSEVRCGRTVGPAGASRYPALLDPALSATLTRVGSGSDNADALAFPDNYPVADEHTLIVPSKHVTSIYRCSDTRPQVGCYVVTKNPVTTRARLPNCAAAAAKELGSLLG